MTVFTPDWKLTVGGVDYTDITISDVQHQSGRTDIYQQPLPSYCQITLLALNGQVLPFDINDSLDLQVKDTSGTYVSLFGGDVTDVTVAVDVPAASTWATYDATETWEDAVNLGLGEIDQPGLYTMSSQSNVTDTIYNVISDIATSAFGYIYEDNAGNIGYADADHRQNYLLINGYIELDARHALGAGLSTIMRSADVRNDIYLNYGSNYNQQVDATDAASIALYGYKAETINSRVHGTVDAQAIADRYIDQRAYPKPAFQSITFPITNPEIDDADRDDLLGVFMGMPVNIENLPLQIADGEFEGYVEGWSWSTRFNELFLTINVSPTEFSQVAMRWNTTPALEAWNTLSATLTWEYATIVA
jgi:hypothetical protein